MVVLLEQLLLAIRKSQGERVAVVELTVAQMVLAAVLRGSHAAQLRAVAGVREELAAPQSVQRLVRGLLELQVAEVAERGGQVARVQVLRQPVEPVVQAPNRLPHFLVAQA